MRGWPAFSEEFAKNVREAEAMARAIAVTASSMDDTVRRTREAIAESRRLMRQAESLLAR